MLQISRGFRRLGALKLLSFSLPRASRVPRVSVGKSLLLPASIRNYSTETVSPNDRMIIGFTCKVCSTRSYKQMSKLAYTKGVVMIKCDGCKNVHLIADHLGWFDSQKKIGTIEDILKEKGEAVQRVAFDPTTNTAQVSQQDGDMLEWLPKAIETYKK